jgi:SAM-dependent methyltransferase
MVGAGRARRCAVALSPAGGAYARMADVWATDAALVYGPMARHLIDAGPADLRGVVALDAGAGPGVAGDVLRARGARVVAVDRELDMASACAGPAAVGDVTALPFRAGSFDVVVAAFVVNHLPDPVAGLAELRRVTRRGGAVLVSSFADTRAGAKSTVDAAAAAYGYVPPGWYADLQTCARGVGSAGAVERALRAAGFARWTVTEDAVDVGLGDAADVVRYRLAVPHLHRFAAGLSAGARAAFVADATAAVRATRERFTPVVVEAVAIA